MDDLNLIREFRGHAVPEPAARERARAALRSAIAGRRARRPRLLLVAAALTVLLVGGGTAYALAREFLIGDPAPPDVKEQAARASSPGKPIIGPALHGPQIRPEGMVLAASLQSSVGVVYLWRAPSDREGDCLFTQIEGTEQPDGSPNLGGGCSGGARGPIDASFAGSRVRTGRGLSLVYGRVDESVQRLVLVLDGRRLPIPLTARFFLFELPDGASAESPALRLLGYDGADRQIAEYKQPAARQTSACSDLDISNEKPALEILTRRTRKPIRAYVFERDGQRCQVLTTPGGSSGGDAILRGPRDIPLGIEQIGSGDNALVLISGVVGDAIERLELHFDDGRVEQLPLAHHVTLYQVDRDDYAQGRQPVKLVGRDATGKVIAERPLR